MLRLRSDSSFSFVACGGATTADVLSGQVAALRTTTTLVTISVGGNDVGFADVVTTCTLGGDQDWDEGEDPADPS